MPSLNFSAVKNAFRRIIPTKETVKKALLWILPSLNAFYEAAVVALGITDKANAENYSVTKRFSLLVPSTTFAFGQSMALNGRSTVQGLEETAHMIKNRKFPDDKTEWPDITKIQKAISLTLTGLITLSVLNADFFSGYFFVDEVPDDYEFENKVNLTSWQAIAIITGIIASSTTAFTECLSLLKTLMQWFAGRKEDYGNLNFFWKWTTIILGNFIAVFGGLENAFEAYASMKKILKPQSETSQYALLGVCTSKLFSDYNFSGRNCMDGIKAFALRMSSKEKIAATEVVAFALSVGTAALVVFAQPYLTQTLIDDPKTSPPFNSPTPFTLGLGWLVTVRDADVQIYKFYPYIHARTKILFDKLHTKLCGEPLLPTTTISTEPLLPSPYSGGNKNVLFSPSPKSSQAQPSLSIPELRI